MTADRGMSIYVVGDDSALVGYDATCTNEQLDIIITNRADQTIHAEVTVNKTTRSTDAIDSTRSATVTFDDPEFEPLDSVDVTAEGVVVTLDRKVPSNCEWSSANSTEEGTD